MSISEMKSRFDWEELRLFLAVARASGLSGAARLTGVSAPTLGRRMTALERRLNQKLFDRKPGGYALTEAGRELYEQAREMEAVATGIDRWVSRRAPRRVVRVSAGAWTSRFLALNIDRLWRPDDPMTLEFLTVAARLDIARREADIGIRNRKPEESRLSGRRTNDVAYAIYRSRHADDGGGEPRWIGVIGDGGVTPSARWVAARHRNDVFLTCTDPRMAVDILHAGTGQAVLPCFVGDSFPELRREGGLIAELAEEQWLVLNDSERRQPAVRLAIDRIAALLREHRALFRGDRPVV
jgi:DNA-binding transcriptional LysR family regulator